MVVSAENFITASGGEISDLAELPLWMICTGLTHSTGVCAGSQVETADKAKLWGSKEFQALGRIEVYFVILIYNHLSPRRKKK